MTNDRSVDPKSRLSPGLRRRLPWLLLAAVVVVVGAVAVVAYALTSGADEGREAHEFSPNADNPDPSLGIEGIVTVDYPPAAHVQAPQRVAYDQSPRSAAPTTSTGQRAPASSIPKPSGARTPSTPRTRRRVDHLRPGPAGRRRHRGAGKERRRRTVHPDVAVPRSRFDGVPAVVGSPTETRRRLRSPHLRLPHGLATEPEHLPGTGGNLLDGAGWIRSGRPATVRSVRTGCGCISGRR